MHRQQPNCTIQASCLNVVNVDLTAALAVVLAEVEADALFLTAVCVGLVDLGRLGQLAVCLQASCFVGVVLEDDVALLVLVVTQRQEDNVALVDPDLLSQLATDVS